jgi:hypothetical protein
VRPAFDRYLISRLCGIIVTRLALTRASVDPAYTKLDLMDREAVEGFFATNKVHGASDITSLHVVWEQGYPHYADAAKLSCTVLRSGDQTSPRR